MDQGVPLDQLLVYPLLNNQPPNSAASKRHCLGLDIRIPPAGFSPAKSAAATDVVRGHVNHMLPKPGINDRDKDAVPHTSLIRGD